MTYLNTFYNFQVKLFYINRIEKYYFILSVLQFEKIIFGIICRLHEKDTV